MAPCCRNVPQADGSFSLILKLPNGGATVAQTTFFDPKTDGEPAVLAKKFARQMEQPDIKPPVKKTGAGGWGFQLFSKKQVIQEHLNIIL